jgi:hypothetical protein
VSGNPGHASSQGAAFYAQDFTSDISVCTVSGDRHGTKHGLSYTKPGDTKHHNKHIPRNHQSRDHEHATWNDLNPDGNNFHHRIRFNGHIANNAAGKHYERQSISNSGNSRCCRKRGIGNRRDTEFHANGNFNHSSAVYACQQHWNIDHGEQHAFNRQHFCYWEQRDGKFYELDYQFNHDDSISFAPKRDISHRCCSLRAGKHHDAEQHVPQFNRTQQSSSAERYGDRVCDSAIETAS